MGDEPDGGPPPAAPPTPPATPEPGEDDTVGSTGLGVIFLSAVRVTRAALSLAAATIEVIQGDVAPGTKEHVTGLLDQATNALSCLKQLEQGIALVHPARSEYVDAFLVPELARLMDRIHKMAHSWEDEQGSTPPRGGNGV